MIINPKIHQKLDKRCRLTQLYLENKDVKPVFKPRAFSYIDKVLGPRKKWINKSPEEYFSEDEITEAKQACKILSYDGSQSFNAVKKTYYSLCRGTIGNTDGWHPDYGGHESAFSILNHAYSIFKSAHLDK